MTIEPFQLFLLGTAAIGATFTAAGSFVGVLISLRNNRLGRRIDAKQDESQRVVQEIRVTTNGRMDELLRITRELALLEGAAQARAMGKVDPAVTAEGAADVLRTGGDAAAVFKAARDDADHT